MFDNEVAADNRMRRFETLSKPAGQSLVEAAENVAAAASLVVGKPEIGLIAKTIGIATRFTSRLGVATLEENLEHLGIATELAIARTERKLEAQGFRIDEIELRIASPELEQGIAAAVLQAQRTKQKQRLDRMAWILANGVAENDLEPESLDDMLRAAAELNQSDIELLGSIYEAQAPLFSECGAGYELDLNTFLSGWNDMTEKGRISLATGRSSLTRLQAHALIQQRVIPGSDYGIEPYVLLRNGAKFYERLQEIGGTR